MKNTEKLLTGSEAVLLGAIAAGADVMYGYPITPSSEILSGWISNAEQNKELKYLQTEDETAAGFAVIGALLAGSKAFTATAGPGHVLMQDPLSMAENLRLPFVSIVMQRGGPSTGTVNFSQQEVFLASFGGNGNGLRVVYSASTVEELYYLTIKAFSTAWKYRFPTFVIGDGHLSKMKAFATITPPIKPFVAEPILQEKTEPTLLRNCYSSEESFGEKLAVDIADWEKTAPKIAEYEAYNVSGAKEFIVAHGSVADCCKDVVDILRKDGRKIGLLRPITLNPFSKEIATIAKDAKKIFIIESAYKQLSMIVKYNLSENCSNFVEISKPAESFTANEIVEKISKKDKNG